MIYQFPVRALVGEHRQGIADDVKHVVGVKVRKGEAVALAVLLVVGEDGVPQAAGLPHHRQGAVAHGDHLRDAAGLKFGGHEE